MRNEPMRRNELPETCFSILPSSGQLIIIRCGEHGYYPSEWDTGSREEKPLERKVTIRNDRLQKYFPASYTPKQMEDVIRPRYYAE